MAMAKDMVSSRSLTGLTAVALFSLCLATAQGLDFPVGINGEFATSRRALLQQQLQSCPVDFNTVDFSSVTSTCRGPSYAQQACCPPFQALACKYKAFVNDFSTSCPSDFLSYLDYKGGYEPGVFVDRCLKRLDALC